MSKRRIVTRNITPDLFKMILFVLAILGIYCSIILASEGVYPFIGKYIIYKSNSNIDYVEEGQYVLIERVSSDDKEGIFLNKYGKNYILSNIVNENTKGKVVKVLSIKRVVSKLKTFIEGIILSSEMGISFR